MEFSKGQKAGLLVLFATLAFVMGYEYWLWHYVPRADYYLCYQNVPLYGQPNGLWDCKINNTVDQQCVENPDNQSIYSQCKYFGSGPLKK